MDKTTKQELIERIQVAFDDPTIGMEKSQKLKDLYRQLNTIHEDNITAEHVNMVNAILG
jgi:hypothetical protein|nr:MAG TPA: Protein inhibitor of activated STAT helix bundle, RIKEN Structural [Caudoviricetes sp.]